MELNQLQDLKSSLMLDEGYKRFVYEDSLGIPTIGIGRNLRDKGISLAEARGLLQNDITQIWQEMTAKIPWILNLNAVRQNVLCNIAFNVGVIGLFKFINMLEACRLAKFAMAAEELLDSKAAKISPSRYKRLAIEIETGIVNRT